MILFVSSKKGELPVPNFQAPVDESRSAIPIMGLRRLANGVATPNDDHEVKKDVRVSCGNFLLYVKTML
jgi:hypothetical protein